MDAEERPEKQVEADAPAKITKSLEMTQSGNFALRSIEDQMSFAKKLMSEGMISSSFKTVSQVVIGIQYAKALGVDIMLTLKNMYVVNGRPCLYGDGPLSLVQRTRLVTLLDEFWVDEDMNRICVENKNLKSPYYAAVTRIKRCGDEAMQEDFFTLDDLARAGMDKNKFGKKDVWEKYERLMLRYKARSMALKSKFADLVSGIPIAEYDFNTAFDEKGIPFEKDVSGPAAELNKTYLTDPTFDKGPDWTAVPPMPESK